MDFWGVEVSPQMPVICSSDGKSYIHVSNVALGDTKKCTEGERVVVSVKVEGKTIVLGTLTPKVCDQIQLDLIFGDEFMLTHSSKSCSIFFSGYKTDAPPAEGDEDEDWEDDEETPMLIKRFKNEEETPKPLSANGAQKHDKKVSEGSESDDESDQSLDSDDFGDEDLLASSDDDSEDDVFGGDTEDDDEDDEDLPTPEPVKLDKKSDKKKRPAESPAGIAHPADKKIKTPSGKPAKVEPKSEAKSSEMPQTTPVASAKKEKKDKQSKNTPKTPDTKAKSKGTPGSDGKTASIGKHRCTDCDRNFNTESGLIQHKTAKHKK